MFESLLQVSSLIYELYSVALWAGLSAAITFCGCTAFAIRYFQMEKQFIQMEKLIGRYRASLMVFTQLVGTVVCGLLCCICIVILTIAIN